MKGNEMAPKRFRPETVKEMPYLPLNRHTVRLRDDVIRDVLRMAAEQPSYRVSNQTAPRWGMVLVYETATSIIGSLWHDAYGEDAVYSVELAKDGTSAKVHGYWGAITRAVSGASATPSELAALVTAWQ